jgi:hypothetical protein
MRSENDEREEESTEIERQIEGLRSELDALVRELDRRRHAATDIRLQIRRHPRAAAVILGLAVLTVVGRLTVLRRRRADTIWERASNLARALALLSNEDPARVRRAVEGRPNPSAIGALAKAGATLVQQRVRPGASAR